MRHRRIRKTEEQRAAVPAYHAEIAEQLQQNNKLATVIKTWYRAAKVNCPSKTKQDSSVTPISLQLSPLHRAATEHV